MLIRTINSKDHSRTDEDRQRRPCIRGWERQEYVELVKSLQWTWELEVERVVCTLFSVVQFMHCTKLVGCRADRD